MRKNDWNKIHMAEMKYLRAVKGCMRADNIRNEDIRKELHIFSVCETIAFYRSKWKFHIQRMDDYRHSIVSV